MTVYVIICDSEQCPMYEKSGNFFVCLCCWP